MNCLLVLLVLRSRNRAKLCCVARINSVGIYDGPISTAAKVQPKGTVWKNRTFFTSITPGKLDNTASRLPTMQDEQKNIIAIHIKTRIGPCFVFPTDPADVAERHYFNALDAGSTYSVQSTNACQRAFFRSRSPLTSAVRHTTAAHRNRSTPTCTLAHAQRLRQHGKFTMFDPG
jgi:hypothetical protein